MVYSKLYFVVAVVSPSPSARSAISVVYRTALDSLESSCLGLQPNVPVALRVERVFDVLLSSLKPHTRGGQPAETDFPRLGLRVRPRRGCALVFFPASEDWLV